ncbi:4-oxalocrotonate tautomerase family protein [Streptomyces sp. NPDC102441]|uniref:tautomerase family protein n=1 Tax=Streptomyces sp. NPDC102441 TaxID=3366176 RepID=UPI0037FAF05F
MPHITVTIAEGRGPQQIRNMLHEIHAAVLRTVDARPEHIRVTVHEIPRTHWATGDVTIAEMSSASADGPGQPPGDQGGKDTATTAEKELT